METTTRQIQVTILTPAEGHVLTQAADVRLAERVVSAKIYLGAGDSPDAWKEITAAEGEALTAAREQSRLAALAADPFKEETDAAAEGAAE